MKQPHWLIHAYSPIQTKQKTQIKQTPKVYNMVASHYVNTKNFETQKKAITLTPQIHKHTAMEEKRGRGGLPEGTTRGRRKRFSS